MTGSAPVVETAPPAKLARWVTFRRVVQYGALLAFIILFVLARREHWRPLAGVFMQLDPLAVGAHLLASRTVLTGSLLALVTVLITFILGRAWCGWLCPLGTVLDSFSPKDRPGRRWTPPEAWRSFKYGLLLTLLVAALLSNLTMLIFDPLTIVLRTLTVSVWPALDHMVTAVETALYPLPPLQSWLSAFEAWIRPDLLPQEPLFYREAWMYAAVFIGIVLSNRVAPRFWCRYLCPLGALLGLFSKVALVRRRVTGECQQCARCVRVCPTGTIQSARNYASDPGECTLCLECWPTCPRNGITFSAQWPTAEWQPYDPGRRHALIALGAAIAGVSLLRSDLAARRDHSHLIRPPGAHQNDLLSRCVRCAACSRVCPTGAIQPALSEAGLEGIWTPVLVLRMGYCDYSCNACGQVCPVQAIPPLSLEDKRHQVLGQAYIDQNRCIAWADQRNCLVCEEMCPVPDKAIKLEEVQVRTGDGEWVLVRRPHVVRARCIGCGICEYKCPVNGEAAIRVYAPGVA